MVRTFGRVLALLCCIPLVLVTSIPVGAQPARSVQSAVAVPLVSTIHVALTGDDTLGTGSSDRPYRTVSHAMSQASAGDYVFVAAGEYVEDVVMTDGVRLVGAGADVTTLRGTGADSVILIEHCDDPRIEVRGFTITGGVASRGGGIWTRWSPASITGNVITGNVAEIGGGVCCFGHKEEVIIAGNEISANEATRTGGGGYYGGGSFHILSNVFSGNTAPEGGGVAFHDNTAVLSGNLITSNSGGEGGGLIYYGLSRPDVYNNVFSSNTATIAGGAIFNEEGDLAVVNNTIYGNSAPAGGGISDDGTWADCTVTNCIVWDNGDDLHGCAATYSNIQDGDGGEGNLSVTPGFVAAGSDFRLAGGSLCIDAGTAVTLPTTDADGAARPLDGDGISGAAYDMGAYERVFSDATAPSDPILASTTHEAGTESSADHVVVTFDGATDSISGVDGFSYSFTKGAPAAAPHTKMVEEWATACDAVLGNGSWYVNVATVDNAGNWSAGTSTGPFEIGCVQQVVAGGGRYETAVEISKVAFPDPSGGGMLVLATGANWPDALGAATLAGMFGGPILLSQRDLLPVCTMREIERLDPARVYIVGGTGVISEPIESEVRSLVPGVQIFRLSGTDRYGTANSIARYVHDWDPQYMTALIATGRDYPDALAAAPLAAVERTPLFLAGPDGLSASTRQAMEDCHIDSAIILGGTGVVSDEVEQWLVAQYGRVNVVRLSGRNRYETAAVIAGFCVDWAGFTWDGVAIATGESFPDALGGGVLQGRAGAPVLLTPKTQLAAATRAALASNQNEIGLVRFLGGDGAVAPEVRDAVDAVLE